MKPKADPIRSTCKVKDGENKRNPRETTNMRSGLVKTPPLELNPNPSILALKSLIIREKTIDKEAAIIKKVF